MDFNAPFNNYDIMRRETRRHTDFAQIEMGISICAETCEISQAAEFSRKVDISDRNLYRSRGHVPSCGTSICVTYIVYMYTYTRSDEHFRYKWITAYDKHCDTLTVVNWTIRGFACSLQLQKPEAIYTVIFDILSVNHINLLRELFWYWISRAGCNLTRNILYTVCINSFRKCMEIKNRYITRGKQINQVREKWKK